LVISIITYSGRSDAIIRFEDAVFPEFATSGRALAMGNAYGAKVDDSSAVFYNPAGLGTVRFPHLHLSNFHLETNKGWMSTAAGGKFTDALSNIPDGISLEGNRKLLLENKGTLTHFRLHMLPNFTTRYFSFGYLLSKQIRATIDNAPGALFEYAERLDHGPYAAMNISMFGGVFKFGASAILLNRNEAIGEQDANTEVNLQDGDYKKGYALIFTSGAKLTLPIKFLPTFSAKLNNSSSTKFKGRAGGAPDPVKSSLDLAFSITPQIANLARIHLEVDYKDFTDEYGVSTTRRTLLGMELDIARVFFMRLGYGDGFGSAGLGIRAKSVEFDLTTYAVDTTSSAFRGAEDRRFSMTLSSGF